MFLITRHKENGKQRLALQIFRTLVTGACLFTISGCSIFFPDPVYPPAKLVNFTPSLTPKVLWSTSIGNGKPYTFSPAVVGGYVYAASADGEVSKLEVAGGKLVWRSRVNKEGLSAGVGTDGELVAVGTNKGEVIVLHASTGKEKWRARVSTEILAAPAVAQGLVLVKTLDNQITALEQEDGKKKWSYQRPPSSLTLRTAAGFTLINNGLLGGFPGGKLVAILLNNGSLRWEANVAIPKGTTELERVADVAGNPVVVGREVCATSFRGRVACFDGVNGTLNWSKDMSSQSGLAADNRFVFVSNERAELFAFSRETGTSIWKNDQLLNRDLSAPLSVGRSVMVGDGQGYVHWFDREDGTLLARMSTDGKPIRAQPILTDRAVIVQSTGGALYAFANE